MATPRTISMTLDEESIELLETWLELRERELKNKLEGVKSMRSQLKVEPLTASAKQSYERSQIADKSWTAKTIEVLKKLEAPQTSTQIIAWLMSHDAALKGKDRRYVTKNVTSKLSILVDKGRVEKTISNGRNVYALKENI